MQYAVVSVQNVHYYFCSYDIKWLWQNYSVKPLEKTWYLFLYELYILIIQFISAPVLKKK